MNIIYHIDIFEYIISHIYISDYDKLKKVSVNFRRIFNINSKDYKDLICIRGCDIKTIMNIVKKRAFNKYHLNKSYLINISSLYDNWFNSKFHNNFITKYYNKVIMADCGIYIEYLMALLYNCEYRKHKNIIDIFDNVSKHLILFPIITKKKKINIIRVIKLCSIILILQNKCENRNRRKHTIRYITYNINVCIYITIFLEAIKINVYTYEKSIRKSLDNLFFLAKKELEYYKNSINNNPEFSKIFPKYYLKYIIDIIEKNII